MSRIYATEERYPRRRFLAYLECDGPGCKERLKPGPHVLESGWMRYGKRDGESVFTWDYCPTCDPGFV